MWREQLKCEPGTGVIPGAILGFVSCEGDPRAAWRFWVLVLFCWAIWPQPVDLQGISH